MERALKERIIGAIVLVAVVVLVVPVFLDGPPGNGEILSERVPLPGQSEQETHTVILDRDRAEPVPAQATPGPAADDPAAEEPAAEPSADKPEPTRIARASESKQPAVLTSPPEDEQQPVAAKAKSTAALTSSATGMWAVQLGSFSSQENAERLAADLRKQGFAAFLSQLPTPSGQLHRVRIGPQKDREAAEAMATRLAKAGHKGQVVPHP